MAESGNRDDWRRKHSLLALGQEDAAPKVRGSSLLSVGADDHHQDVHSEDDVQDAATRHRLARFRREAEQAARDEAIAEAAPAQAQPHTGPIQAQSAPATIVAPAPRPEANDVADRTSMLGGRRGRLSRSTPPPLAAAVPPVPEPAPVYEDEGDDARWRPLIDPMKVIGGITRSKWLITTTTLVGALLGVAIALSTPKMYQAWTEMIVDPRNLKLTDRDLTDTGLPSDATLAIVENQVRVMTSGSVLTKVVDKLNLADDPEFNGTAGSGGFSPRAFVKSLLGAGEAGGDDAGRRHTLATEHLAQALTVERGGKTFVISIGAKTREPEKSALIANTMTEVFMQTYGELQAGTAGRATDELNARLNELRSSVEAAERKVESFKAENDLINPQGRLITDDEIQRVNDQLTAARARTLELNARASSTRNVGVDAVLTGALPEAINSPAITELRAQYAALTQEADRASVRLGPRHPERQAVEAQLSGARERIATELKRVAGSIQVELKRAVQTEQELAARLAQLKVRQGSVGDELVTLRELERDVAAKRSVYEAFLLRARETGEQRDINPANASVISVASPPLESTGPSRAMISLAGAFLGFAAGVGIGGMRGALESLRETAARRTRENRRRNVSGEGTSGARAEPVVPPRSTQVAESVEMATETAPAPVQQPAPPPMPYGGMASPYPPQPGFAPVLPQAGYGASYPYPPQPPAGAAYHPWPQAPQPAMQHEPQVPTSQIEEISASLREVRKELNQLRERRSRRYF